MGSMNAFAHDDGASVPADLTDSHAHATHAASIVVTSHNRASYLEQAVASALNQDCAVEVIVVDDGSTEPDTLALLDTLERASDVTVLRKENGGPASARNYGIRQAGHEYVLCLDDDDMIKPGYASRAVAILSENENVAVVYSDGRRFGSVNSSMRFPQIDGEWLALGNCILQASFFRKSDWERLGGYDETLKRGYEDYDFWLRIAMTGRGFHHVQEEFVMYREGNPSLMSEIRADQRLKSELAMHVYDANSEFYDAHKRAIFLSRVEMLSELRWWRFNYSRIEKLFGRPLRRATQAARQLKSFVHKVRKIVRRGLTRGTNEGAA